MGTTKRDEIQNLQLSILQDFFHIMMKEKYGEEKWVDRIIQICEKKIKYGKKNPGYTSLVGKYHSEGRARITEKTIDITIIYALLCVGEIKSACSVAPSEEDVLFKHVEKVEKDYRTYFDIIEMIKDDRNTFSHLGSYDDSIKIKTIEIDAVAHCYDFVLYLIENNWGEQSEERREYVAKYINDSYNLFHNLVEGASEKKKSDIQVTNNIVVSNKAGNPVPGFRMVIQDSNQQVVDEWISENTPHRSIVNEGEYLIVMRQPPSQYKFSVPTRVLIKKENEGETIKIEAERKPSNSSQKATGKNKNSKQKAKKVRLSEGIAKVATSTISLFLYFTPIFILLFQNQSISDVNEVLRVTISCVGILIFLALILLDYGIGGLLDIGEDIVWISTVVGLLLLAIFLGLMIAVESFTGKAVLTGYESVIIFVMLMLIALSNGVRHIWFDEEIPRVISVACFSVVGALLLHYPISCAETYIKQAPIRTIAADFISQDLELGDSSLVKKVTILDEDDNGRYIATGEVANEKYIVLFYKDSNSEKWFYFPKYSVENIENDEAQEKSMLRMKEVFSWDQKQDIFAKEHILQQYEQEAIGEAVTACLGLEDSTQMDNIKVVDRDAYGRCLVLAKLKDKMYMVLIVQRDGSWKNIPASYTVQEVQEDDILEEKQKMKAACKWGHER